MQADAVAAALAQAHRSEWAFVLSATVRVAGDLDVAEECAQEAYVSALQAWTRDGVPERPGGWLTTAARNKALDRLRREVTLRRKLPLLVEPATVDPHGPADLDWPDAAVPDDRLRLVFTCCHPTLAPEARVALTLRLVCGVPTPDVARAFLVSEPTMAARITRAKKKISEARIPYRVPGRAELPERLDSVLTAVHLLFSTGHTAGEGDALVREELCDRALHLARTLAALLPEQPEPRGLLGLLLLTDARRATRTDEQGRLLLLAAALDPRAELHLYDLKGTGDLSALEPVAHAYRAGDEEEDIDYAVADMRAVHAEMRRRTRVIRELPRALCPESKITPELAGRRDLGLWPIVVGADECQRWFEHKRHGAPRAGRRHHPDVRDATAGR